jgi:hypothetical protein
MSDNPDQEHEATPRPDASAHQEAVSHPQVPPAPQESFGEPFPEQPASAVPPTPPSYDNPAFYNRDHATSYGTPPAYPYGYYTVPPQQFYEQQFYEQQRNAFQAQPATPLPLWEAIRQLPRQYWYVLMHPKATTFLEQEGKAAWNIIWIQLLILGIVESLVLLVIVFLEFVLFQALFPASIKQFLNEAIPIVVLATVLFSLISVPISFFFGAGFYHLIAKAFGGRGTFLSYCYNYALIIVPLSIASVVLSLIPCLGSLVGSAAGIYEIVLVIFMTMGIQRLSGGRASATVLIPVITGIVLVIAAYVAYFVLLLSALPHS